MRPSTLLPTLVASGSLAIAATAAAEDPALTPALARPLPVEPSDKGADEPTAASSASAGSGPSALSDGPTDVVGSGTTTTTVFVNSDGSAAPLPTSGGGSNSSSGGNSSSNSNSSSSSASAQASLSTLLTTSAGGNSTDPTPTAELSAAGSRSTASAEQLAFDGSMMGLVVFCGLGLFML